MRRRRALIAALGLAIVAFVLGYGGRTALDDERPSAAREPASPAREPASPARPGVAPGSEAVAAELDGPSSGLPVLRRDSRAAPRRARPAGSRPPARQAASRAGGGGGRAAAPVAQSAPAPSPAKAPAPARPAPAKAPSRPAPEPPAGEGFHSSG